MLFAHLRFKKTPVLFAALLPLCVIFIMGMPGYAYADSYQVTFVARECQNYTDVMANKARNNIMESLENLGPDSAYGDKQAVSPTIEESISTQVNNCIPLLGWQFGIGRGISGSKDTGSYGSLSKVATLLRMTGDTKNNVVEKDPSGKPTGRKLDGAVTFTLNDKEKDLMLSNQLVVQGGRPGDPLLGSQVLGFATLRCGYDDLNADNVEFTYFKSVSHIYCYAYYINPAPTAAKIIITKVVEDSSIKNVPFPFTGNTSFTPNGTFSLRNGESATFERASVTGDSTPWVVTENTAELPPGYDFSRIACTTKKGSTYVIRGSTVSISLVGGDVVQCTFYNQVIPTLVPLLDCTAKSGPQDFTAHWGYFNERTSLVTMPAGNNNYFSPAPISRGQPYSFLPGREQLVFSVDHTGGPLTWELTGNAATSTSDAAQRCAPTCILPTPITPDECAPSFIIDGSLSGTLNNDGVFTSIQWTSSCPGSFTNDTTLRPEFTVDFNQTNKTERCSVTLQVTDNTQYGSNNPAEIQTKSCNAKVTIPACKVDCAGVPNGHTEVDLCGVCGGDNSTCLDCKGVPNGGAVVDACGICDGNNQSCLDCAGVPNGGAVVDACGVCGGDGTSCAITCPDGLDLCGVCGGDNSSCKDCAGVPNGTSTIDICGVCGGDGSSCNGSCQGSVDACGICNGDGSTCADCAGVPNGSAKVDICGVCNGDNSSCEIDTGCNGGVYDACGVCNGNGSTCHDCAGIPNGGTKVDLCGICGGDGSSCGNCVANAPINPEEKLRALRIVADLKLLEANADNYRSQAVRCAPSKKKELNESVAKIKVTVAAIKNLIKNDLSQIENQCTISQCAVVSIETLKELISTLARQLRSLSRESQLIVAQCRKPIESKDKKRDSAMLRADIDKLLSRLGNTVIACVPDRT